jgi:hypothetical protein
VKNIEQIYKMSAVFMITIHMQVLHVLQGLMIFGISKISGQNFSDFLPNIVDLSFMGCFEDHWRLKAEKLGPIIPRAFIRRLVEFLAGKISFSFVYTRYTPV